MPLTLNIATIISISIIGMRLLEIRNCFVILVITVRVSSKMQGPIMLKQLVALLHISLSRDFWGICNSVLNRGKSSVPPLFNGPEVLITSTDKANLFARNFPCNSTFDDGSQQLPDFPTRTEQRLSSKKITFKMVSHAIYDLDESRATSLDRIPLFLRCDLQSFLLFLLSYIIYALSNLVFLPVGNLHRLCHFLKTMERDLIQVSLVL